MLEKIAEVIQEEKAWRNNERLTGDEGVDQLVVAAAPHHHQLRGSPLPHRYILLTVLELRRLKWVALGSHRGSVPGAAEGTPHRNQFAGEE